MSAVSAARPSAPLRWLRWALLVAMLVVVVAVAGLFYLGRSARPRAGSAPGGGAGADADQQAPTPRDAVVVSQGFEYEQQVEGKPVFRIRGDSMTTDRGGKVELEGVGLELYREGEPFTMSSRRAVYDRESGEAQLEGDVHLAGSKLWELEAERLDLVDGGKTVVSGKGGKERVRFRRGRELAGSAGAMRFTLDDERLELSQGVRVAGREEDEGKRMVLEARRVSWQRDGRTIEAEAEDKESDKDRDKDRGKDRGKDRDKAGEENKVELVWGRSRLRAERISALLLADESGIETARATGKVTGVLVPERGNRLEFDGERCDVAIDAASSEPSRVALAGGPAAPARLEWKHEAATRTLVAPEVEVDLVAGVPSTALATGGVRLDELVRGRPRRIVASTRLDARFDTAGELDSADLDGAVEIEDGEQSASGESAKLTAGGERIVLTGSPARSRSPRGELEAPHLLFEQDKGRLSAEGGVRARFESESSPLASSEASTAREPVRVEAKSGAFLQDPKGFVFEGQVQAVQGSSLLFADRLAGDEATGTTTATGKVRTIWIDAPAQTAARGAKRAGTAPKAPQTVATAESLEYKRAQGEMRYAGDVLVRQEPRELRASEVTVKLSEAKRAERMHARGAVAVVDGASGRTVSGDEADYDLAAKSALVTGEPVTIKDRDGNVLKGKRALFDLESGDAKLLSGDS
jgi:lipopolysaccharide export system protein LptA